MPGYDFKCECCGEEYDSSLKFKGYIINSDSSTEPGVKEVFNEVCPDCLGTWFQEDPESIKEVHFTKVEVKS